MKCTITFAFLACHQVELWIESLHDKRARLEVVWLRQKSELESGLSVNGLLSDLCGLEEWIEGRGKDLIVISSLGESVTSAEILLHEHKYKENEVKVMNIHGFYGRRILAKFRNHNNANQSSKLSLYPSILST